VTPGSSDSRASGRPASADRRPPRPRDGRPSLATRRLYLCTPDRSDLGAFVDACIRGGVDIVQLREKHLSDRQLLERAKVLKLICADHGVPFVVNDRPDLALEAGADGVHVGQDDAPPSLARRILGPDALIGQSTHASRDLDETLGPGGQVLDYISAGPVVETPTKPTRPAAGREYIATAAARSPRPVFVTGGVTPQTVGDLVARGARHFVVVRWLTGASEPEEAARALRRSIDMAITMAVEMAEPGTSGES